MKRFTFLAVFLILGTLAFSAEVGEKTYKEVTVNGKTLSKWVEVLSISEYDNNGNLIHYKNSDGKEEWNEYDNNGNLIHSKYSTYTDSHDKWNEYDSNGNLIHSKYSYGWEEWHEYDNNGNLIHFKNSDGDEKWYEYTYWKNGKVKITTEYCTF